MRRISEDLKATLQPHIRRSKWFRRWYGERRLKRIFKKLYNKDLDLNDVNTFSEKLFRRMILVNRYGNPTYTRLADKYLVRDYVREKVGDCYLVKLLWQGTSPFNIPFDALPQRYVIKANHGSGYNIIVDGRADRQKITEKAQACLKENFYWKCYEYHYFDISPKLLIEEFVDDGWPKNTREDLLRGFTLTYTFWCFDSVPAIIQVAKGFYDTAWNKLDLITNVPSHYIDIAKPVNFDQMLTVAKRLSEGFDFVRVDLFNDRGAIFFNEFTFTPSAGQIPFKPSSWDITLGQKWRI